ncbi:MAG TPA: triose-phosphate isomerase, partial [Petrimonas sp.]|nr:triose-phosphate isomerase [Petrimonas sp.]
MYKGLTIKPPFFEIGPKAYMYGERMLRLAKAADEASVKYDVRIILTLQPSDIYLLARETEHVLIFAQHMDPVPIGRGNGSILPEALKAAGAVGVILNHAEKPMTLADLSQAIKRAD